MDLIKLDSFEVDIPDNLDRFDGCILWEIKMIKLVFELDYENTTKQDLEQAMNAGLAYQCISDIRGIFREIYKYDTLNNKSICDYGLFELAEAIENKIMDICNDLPGQERIKMGLDTTHNCFRGPYSLFDKWREEVCNAAGYKYDEQSWGLVDVLAILLDHSDCDGYIHWKNCEALANRLEELIPNQKEYSHITIQFVRGLREAFKNKENVGFH